MGSRLRRAAPLLAVVALMLIGATASIAANGNGNGNGNGDDDDDGDGDDDGGGGGNGHGDPVCIAAENARHQAAIDRINQGRLDCIGSCHHQGGGSGGR